METDLSGKTDEEIADGLAAYWAESNRRQRLSTAEREVIQIVQLYAEALGRADGDAYVAPTGYVDAYALDAVVIHDGKTWRSTRHGATGIPGQSPDWREVAQGGEILEWVQPHAGSEYPVAALVQHKGHIWRNDHVSPNGWEPGTVGSQWTDLGTVEDYYG